MKPLRACGFATFAVAILAGCTTTHTLSVSPDNRAAPFYARGRPWLESAKTNTVAVSILTPTYQTYPGDLLPPAFLLVVRNGGDRMLSLSSNDVTATAEGRPIRLLTAAEYRDEVTRRFDREVATIESASRAVNAPLRASQQGMDSTGQMVGGTDPLGYVDAMKVPGADAAFEAEASRHIRSIDQRRNTLLAGADLMLKPDPLAIAPGRAVAGVVRLSPSALPRGQRLKLSVNAGGETHEFLYEVGD